MSVAELWWRTYDEEGFVVVDDVISPLLLVRMRRFLAGIERRHPRLPPYLRSRVQLQQPRDGSLTAELSSQPSQVAALGDVAIFGAPFEELIFLPKLLDVVEALVGGCEFSFRYAGLGVRLSTHATSKAEDFHREANPRSVTEPRGVVAILPLEKMDASNGGTRFVCGSHRISDAEAMQGSRQVNLTPCEEDVVTPTVEAGSVLFFGHKVIHAAGPMEADAMARRTIFMDWLAPGVLPTTFGRRAYDGIRPRSQLLEYRQQRTMSFPWRFREPRPKRKRES